MKLKPLKANMTELEIGTITILFSYKTPVAYHDGQKFYKTEQHYSRTTLKHITTWLNGAHAVTCPQSQLDQLIQN
jgi:hypothetical protein